MDDAKREGEETYITPEDCADVRQPYNFTEQLYFITATWVEMPPAILAVTGAGAPEQQPRIMQRNELINVHPALHAEVMGQQLYAFTITFAMPCPVEVFNRIVQMREHAQRAQQEAAGNGTAASRAPPTRRRINSSYGRGKVCKSKKKWLPRSRLLNARR